MQHRLILLVIALLSFGMMPVLAQDMTNITDGCVESYDERVDYFPDKVEVQDATGFDVTYGDNYKLVEITPWQNAESTFTYLLVQCGTPAPDIEANAVIDVPVSRFVAMSTTILPLLEAQGLLDNLVGVDTLLFSNNDAVLAMADDLTLVGGGGSFDELNVEVLIDLDPDLVMTQQFSAAGTTLATIEDAGVPVVLNADFADTSPLGQAEWVKYVALFFNTEAQATENYEAVRSDYMALAELTDDVDERPTVMAASPFDGTWYMPGGDSTVSQLIEDAGGDFLWSEEAGTSLFLDVESVLERGIDADYWVNINQFWSSTDDMLSDDPRYADFEAFAEGNLWNNNKIQNENGGNAYFELGVVNPQLILADLIAIFHPELLPDHAFVFYQPLTAPADE